MDAPIAENKMGDSGVEGVSALQVSVSFGRFTSDTLSWEKWSTFPTNKYLDEVEKCSTAGSVAQKKAFFEAHYKNVAARKAEQEGQDKKRGNEERDLVDLEDPTRRGSMCHFNAVEGELDVDKSNGENSVNGIDLENEVSSLTIEISSSQTDEPKDDVDIINESKDPVQLIENVKDESSCRPGSPELHKSEESVLVKEEAPSLGLQEVEESRQHIEDTRESASRDSEEKVKSEKSLKSQKVTTVKKVTNTDVLKKKPTSSTPKSSATSTPKLSMSTLSKKENGTSPLTSKKPARAETRRAAPTSLHMSLSLDPAKSEPTLSTTMRKSLIMERMGDKEIVKRVFKAFQNNFNQLSSSSPAKPSATSEIPRKETDIKASLVGTPQKKTEGGNRLVKKSSPLSGQAGPRKTSNPTRVINTVGAVQRSSKSVPSPYGLRSYDKPANGNKVLKKLEEKVNGKAAGRAQLQCKDKKLTNYTLEFHDV